MSADLCIGCEDPACKRRDAWEADVADLTAALPRQCSMCESDDCRRESAWEVYTESVSAMKQNYSKVSAQYMKSCLREFVAENGACHSRIWLTAYNKLESARAAL